MSEPNDRQSKIMAKFAALFIAVILIGSGMVLEKEFIRKYLWVFMVDFAAGILLALYGDGLFD